MGASTSRYRARGSTRSAHEVDGRVLPGFNCRERGSRAPALHRLRSSPRALREFCFCFCRRSPSRCKGSWPSRWALWARRWRRLPRALQGLQSSPNDRPIINLYINSAGCGSPFDTGRSFAWRGFPQPAFKISTRLSAGFAIDQKLDGRALLLSERARHDGIGCGEGAKRPGGCRVARASYFSGLAPALAQMLGRDRDQLSCQSCHGSPPYAPSGSSDPQKQLEWTPPQRYNAPTLRITA